MAETKTLPERKDIPLERRWRLEDIFTTDEDWERAYQSLEEDLPHIQTYQGTLGSSADQLYACLQLEDALSERLGKLYTYAHMRYDEDTTHHGYQTMFQKAQSLAVRVQTMMSFIVPEILSIPAETLQTFLSQKKELALYRQFLMELEEKRAHVLSEREEALLAQAGELMMTPYTTYSMLSHADLTFPTIKDEHGADVPLTASRYTMYLESKDRAVRASAYQALYDTYGQFKHTFAAMLTGMIKAHIFVARARRFPSARAAALHENHIPEIVYDQLIKAVREKLPSFHRYVALRKKILGLDDLRMYDLYTPLVPDVTFNIRYEEAQDIILKSLAPMGEAYLDIIREAFQDRWIDVEENKGKRSGAYSSGAYGTKPYILMNWQNNLHSLYTLAHELGHSVHSYYTRAHQPYRYGDYSIFVAEVASTFHEHLLSHYLLETLPDARQKLSILNHDLEGFRGTVFRQTMFAEFEYDVHERVQKGEALTADTLSQVYGALNRQYYGEAVTYDDRISLEWARIPHFYYNFYVYQYATGYSAAATLAHRVLSEGEEAVRRYIDFLKAGKSAPPLDVLNVAGVDMRSKEPILAALELFEKKLSQLEKMMTS